METPKQKNAYFHHANGNTPPLAHSSFQGPAVIEPTMLSESNHNHSTPTRNSTPESAIGTPLGPGVYYSTDTLNTGTSSKRYLVPDDVSDGKQHFGVDENVERGNWTGRMDFLLSCLGYAVGLGNVWRFPYLAYRNGGGAFFIPYFIMLVFVGIPLFFMELSLGQFSSNSPLTCWKFAPLFKGIGVAQLIVSGLVGIYYNVIIAWSLYYLFATLINIPKGVPWATCDNWWNTNGPNEYCFHNLPDLTCTPDEGLMRYSNGSCYNTTTDSIVGVWNYTIFKNDTGIRRRMASEEYYNNRVMRLSSGIDDMGPVEWDLALSLLGAWVIAFLCMVKGIKSSGKVVYFTALFPYLVLVILLGRGASLEGARDGVMFFIKPQWERLADARVWNDAAVQIFFSLSNCWGGLIALSSYNRFHNNCLRDTVIVALGNCSTSIFAGFVIFSFMGFMAKELNTNVEDVVDSGPGLAFIVYPDAVTRMPLSPLWAILFFLMLITLGLDSQFAMLETLLSSILDQFKHLRPHKSKVIMIMCAVLFLLGLTMCSHGGAYMLQLMDTYCGGWAILIIGLFECIAIGWVYGCPNNMKEWLHGTPRFLEDIRIMIGYKQSLWWRICWQFISPGLILFILLFTWADYSPARYGDKSFPAWADALGWLMSLASVIWIPIIAIYKLWKEDDGNVCERMRYLTLPTEEWGPALVKHRKLVDYVEGFVVDPWNTGTKKDRLPAFENWGMVYGDPANMNGIKQQKPVQPEIGYGTPSTTHGSINFSRNASFDHLSRSQASLGNISHVSFESVV